MFLAAAATAAMATSSGCASPLFDQPERDLRRAVREASARELAEAQRRPQGVTTRREALAAELKLEPEVLEELNRMAGPQSYANDRLDLGVSLYGSEQPIAMITLEHVVKTAVENNLNASFARLAPAIGQAQVAAAEAAFDWVLFNNATWSLTDQPRTNSSINGSTVGVSVNNQNSFDNAIGVRKPLISGGQVTVQHQFVYTDDSTPNLFLNPDPSRSTNIVLQLDQPLLRNFGSDFTLAQVRLARNEERDSIQELKGTLDRTVSDAEELYWNLARARDDLLVLQRLLARGEEVVEKLRTRPDVRPSNLANATSAVLSRRADVRRAQRVLRSASDALKVAMNDRDYPIGGEVLLLPVDTAIDQPVEFSLLDALNTAMANRPEIQRAIISIDNTSIRRLAADNQRLPQLNLRALTRFNALAGSTADAYDELTSGRFIDYQVQVLFEMPIGNRAAEASYRQRMLESMQAVIAYQNTLQNVFSEVKNQLRNIATDYALIEDTRVARLAAAEELRQLLNDEETTAGLTPEFLDLKLRQQQSLAAAEQQENQALVDYNIALARLHLATGTALERNRILFEVPHIRPEARESDLFPDYTGEPGVR
ncbi:MAG: TolC family protein [Phycisphaerales bacterium]